MLAVSRSRDYGARGAAASPQVYQRLRDAAPRWGGASVWVKDITSWMEGNLAGIFSRHFDGGSPVVRNAVVTEDRMAIRVLFPRLAGEVQGSVVGGGIGITLQRHSDVGVVAGVETYLERLVCTNGMTVAEREPRRFEQPSQLVSYLDSLLETDTTAFHQANTRRAAAWQASAVASRDGAWFLRSHDSVREALAQLRLSHRHLHAAMAVETGDTAFHLINAVSRVATDLAAGAAGVPGDLMPDEGPLVPPVIRRRPLTLAGVGARQTAEPSHETAFVALQALAGALLDDFIETAWPETRQTTESDGAQQASFLVGAL